MTLTAQQLRAMRDYATRLPLHKRSAFIARAQARLADGEALADALRKATLDAFHTGYVQRCECGDQFEGV
jgi:hypothetical protein